MWIALANERHELGHQLTHVPHAIPQPKKSAQAGGTPLRRNPHITGALATGPVSRTIFHPGSRRLSTPKRPKRVPLTQKKDAPAAAPRQPGLSHSATGDSPRGLRLWLPGWSGKNAGPDQF